MLKDRSTLAQFLTEERRRHPDASGELISLVLDVALACKAISRRVAQGALSGAVGPSGTVNVQGETQHRLDVVANDIVLRAAEGGGRTGGMVSEELDEPYVIPAEYRRGAYLLCFDPLDGSSNVDVNVTVGSIFSILPAPVPGAAAVAEDFLQPGVEQVCAGYALYGPATMLVLTLGRGVHGFTLDPALDEFILTHEDMRVPESTSEFAINSSNRRFWEPAVRRYVDECLAGSTGPRGKDFNMRWVASLVADTHRILTRGGVYLYPRDLKDPRKAGRLRLLYEANPVAMLIEQAGGSASTGRGAVLEVAPTDIHQRVGLVFGARDEVERIEEYHHDPDQHDSTVDLPFYGTRGLFRASF